MTSHVDAATLKQWLGDGAELALFDVRELGEYSAGHLFFAVPLPYSRFEIDLARLAPRRSVRMVLYDDGTSGVARLAARRAQSSGYDQVCVLKDGTAGWTAAGFRLFDGVNVPSKAFGELVEEACHTPRVTAAKLREMQERGEKLVIVDGRPLAEYRKMNIPGGVCCPNGELPLRIGALVPDPATPIVVNCAGRTRSIIGAQTLINFGVKNPVYALENGTQGWFLAGLELERGASRSYPAAPSGPEREALRARAREVAARFSVPLLSTRVFKEFVSEEQRTTYLLDVRTAEEFAAGSVPGARHAPGGQLVQATDQWVGVRNARIVLCDDDGVRAIGAASWLRQMGHDAGVLAEGIAAKVDLPQPSPTSLPRLTSASAAELPLAQVVDLRPSADYREGHLPGSTWSIRPRLRDLKLDKGKPVILVAAEEGIAEAAAIDLAERGFLEVRQVLAESLQGLTLEATPASPPDDQRIDFVFHTHRRHAGVREDALAYLRWETELVAKLDAQERAAFRL